MPQLLTLSALLFGFATGPEERLQDSCAHLPQHVLADLKSLAQKVADEGQLRRHVLKAMRMWCRDNDVNLSKQTKRCISEISKATGAPDKPPLVLDPATLETTKQLEAVLEQEIHDAYVRRDLDRVWEAYRRLQVDHKLDQNLREKVRTFVLRLYGRLPDIDRKVKPPYDRKRSAKWNRENRNRPVRTFDSRYSGADVYRYKKPYHLVAVVESIKGSEKWEDNGTTYMILSRDDAAGKRIIVKLPKSTSRWDRRIDTVTMLAELQPFARSVPGYDFDTVVVPLIISAEFSVRTGSYDGRLESGSQMYRRIQQAAASRRPPELVYEEESILDIQ